MYLIFYIMPELCQLSQKIISMSEAKDLPAIALLQIISLLWLDLACYVTFVFYMVWVRDL